MYEMFSGLKLQTAINKFVGKSNSKYIVKTFQQISKQSKTQKKF